MKDETKDQDKTGQGEGQPEDKKAEGSSMAKAKKDELTPEFQSMKDKIMAQPKVKLFIPKDKLNPAGHRWVCINGVEFYLAVGKEIEVPQCVAEVWNNSFNETMKAEERITTDNEVMA